MTPTFNAKILTLKKRGNQCKMQVQDIYNLRSAEETEMDRVRNETFNPFLTAVLYIGCK
jgi:hypothetical protein